MNTNLLDRMKLLFRKDKELYFQIYDILGFYPHNIELYQIALAHRSKMYKNHSGRAVNNERLEYLGDAVLETIVSDIVFKKFPRRREGFLTNVRSKVVQRSTLNLLAEKMGLSKLISLNTRPTTKRNNIGGNAFEAFIGAVYLDRGFKKCYEFVDKRILGQYINLEALSKKEENFKSRLLEWSQKNKLRAEFKLENTEGENSNSPVFNTVIILEGKKAGKGRTPHAKHSKRSTRTPSLRIASLQQRKVAPPWRRRNLQLFHPLKYPLCFPTKPQKNKATISRIITTNARPVEVGRFSVRRSSQRSCILNISKYKTLEAEFLQTFVHFF